MIAANTVVLLRYCMKNKEGEILENILCNAPVSYLHGSGNILPALEASLEGLKAGEKKSVVVLKDEVSGLNEEFYFDVIIDEVRSATGEEIKNKKPVEQTKNECGPGCC